MDSTILKDNLISSFYIFTLFSLIFVAGNKIFKVCSKYMYSMLIDELIIRTEFLFIAVITAILYKYKFYQTVKSPSILTVIIALGYCSNITLTHLASYTYIQNLHNGKIKDFNIRNTMIPTLGVFLNFFLTIAMVYVLCVSISAYDTLIPIKGTITIILVLTVSSAQHSVLTCLVNIRQSPKIKIKLHEESYYKYLNDKWHTMIYQDHEHLYIYTNKKDKNKGIIKIRKNEIKSIHY